MNLAAAASSAPTEAIKTARAGGRASPGDAARQLLPPAPLRCRPARRPDFVRDLAEHGDRLALQDGPTALTYTELAAEVELASAALGPVRRLVLLSAESTREAVVAYLAALAGGHVVLLVPGGDEDRLQSWVTRYDPDVVVRATGRSCTTHQRRVGTVHDLHPDLALLLSTSGSTGSPKLVRLSYDNVDANTEAIATYLRLDDTDRTVTTLPLAYCYGLSVLHTHLLRGAGVVLTRLSVVDEGFLALCAAQRVTSLAGVPYTFDLLDRAGLLQADLPSLRRLTQAGGRMRPEQVRRYARAAQQRGVELFVMYGQTEATARIAYLPPALAASHPGAVGVPVAGGELFVDGDDGTGVGELVYRGPNVMLGYAEQPADLALGRTVHQLRTGDLGRSTPEGLFEVVGRGARRVKVFGLRLDLSRLQDALAEAGVIAWCTAVGDRLVVVVQGPTEDERARHRAALASGLPLSAVRTVGVAALPRTDSGKIDAHAAGALVAKELAAAEALTARPDRAGPGDVAALYAEVLGCHVTQVVDDSSFASLGGDSLSYVEMSLCLEELLGGLPPDWPTTSVRDLQLQTAGAPAGGRRRLDITVLLRALAIVLIVGTHAHVFAVLGGAHALVTVAGFNVARFRLTAAPRAARVAGLWTAARRIVVPSVAVIALASVVTPELGPAQVALLNDVLGPDVLGPQWRYWFVEVLVQLLAGLALLLSVPALDRAERRWPLAFPAALLGLGLLTRFDIVALGPGPDRTQSAAGVLWLFALGWCAARASRRVPARLLVTAMGLLLVPGFFGHRGQTLVVLGAVALLIWAPSLAVPARLTPLLPVVGLLAQSSLWIYLTHWQVLPLLRGRPILSLLACLTVGVLTRAAARRASRAEPLSLVRSQRWFQGVVNRSGSAGG